MDVIQLWTKKNHATGILILESEKEVVLSNGLTIPFQNIPLLNYCSHCSLLSGHECTLDAHGLDLIGMDEIGH